MGFSHRRSLSNRLYYQQASELSDAVHSSVAMTERHFKHGKLQVASRNSKVSLSLSSSFTLALPPLPAEPVTAADISLLSRTGQLWIAKATSCRLEVVCSAEGMELDPRAVQTCIDSIVDCPVCVTTFQAPGLARCLASNWYSSGPSWA